MERRPGFFSGIVCIIGILSAEGAAEDAPPIISETAQAVAIELRLGENLGIEWKSPSAEDVNFYFDVLTVVDTIAAERAEAAGTAEPSYEDYLAAAAALCIWPPNKPPRAIAVSASDRDFLQGSFTQVERRDRLREAIGPLLLEGPLDDIESMFSPTIDVDDYKTQIIDFDLLREGR